MKAQNIFWCGLGLAALLMLAACGDDGDNGTTSLGGTNTNNNTNQLVPASLAGKTFSFTTTASGNFSEPPGSTFTIAFTDQSRFLYTPSPQSTAGPGPFLGIYSYDPSTATANFTAIGLPETMIIFTFTGPGAGTAHMTHPDGGSLDANFTEI